MWKMPVGIDLFARHAKKAGDGVSVSRTCHASASIHYETAAQGGFASAA
jgi:hypothetical protein